MLRLEPNLTFKILNSFLFRFKLRSQRENKCSLHFFFSKSESEINRWKASTLSPHTDLPIQVRGSPEAPLQVAGQSSAGLNTDWLICRDSGLVSVLDLLDPSVTL